MARKRKPSSTTPTARSLEWCRAQGCRADVVERWKPIMRDGKFQPYGVRVDAFGFGDILVCRPDRIGATLVQATSDDRTSNSIERLKKIQASEDARVWLLAGNVIEVHAWRRLLIGKRIRWVVKRWLIGLQDGEIVAAREEDEHVAETDSGRVGGRAEKPATSLQV